MRTIIKQFGSKTNGKNLTSVIKRRYYLFSLHSFQFAVGLYFWFSLIYLIGRTLALSLYAASINDESKVPLEVFRTVSRDDWCLEVKRFNEEVSNDTIALSGLRFFNLTRKLILSVAGTIVTYELVLIQFHQSDDITDYDPCQRQVQLNLNLFKKKKH